MIDQLNDLSGRRFGRLTVLNEANRIGRVTIWHCRCICGTHKWIQPVALLHRLTQSCGCLRKEIAKMTNTTHGMEGTPTYIVWSGMHARCRNPKEKSYKAYGGRGIYVCRRWKRFINFFHDMGERPFGLSINRIDNNGPYSPKNCEWATRRKQMNNKRSNHLIAYNGKTHTLSEWARKTGIERRTLASRLRSGWPIHEVLFSAVKR